MKLTKRSSETSVMDRPFRLFNRFFDDMWRDPFRLLRTPTWFDLGEDLMPWRPMTDVEETDDAYLVRVDLPGLKKKDVHVTLQDNVLTISGERKRESSKKEDGYRMQERFHGKFERAFTLPGDVDASAINAEFKDGVLTVTLKKSEERKAKEIQIR